MGHKRSIRGLYQRGSIYQFRVRVPVDLRNVIAHSHLKRSLRTGCRSLAIRLSRKVAAEIEASFEEARRRQGLPHDSRILGEEPVSKTVADTMPERSEATPFLRAMDRTADVGSRTAGT
ncbi:MAG: DUF6538 domain-containing protein [Novosphingobium sp.]